MTWDADIVFEVDAVNFNCECDDDWETKTLATLRTDLMVRLGYAAMVGNPPPGMATLMDSFLQDAQEQLYRRYKAMRIKRIFSWTMTPGTRYYGISNNDGQCGLVLDPRQVEWVGVEDLNEVWYPMIEGIPPWMYTRVQLMPGWPTRYEIRSCIEVFPAPREAYTIRIKGLTKLASFSADTDTTTIDYHPVFLLALGNAKSHYGHPDAGNIFSQVDSHVGALVAGTHKTARYVPKPKGWTEAQTPPTMKEWIE